MSRSVKRLSRYVKSFVNGRPTVVGKFRDDLRRHMSEHHILLIHGTWCNGKNWGDFATEMERRGFTVHTPTLRHHGPPNETDVWGNAQRVTNVGLLDYVADLAELVDAMDSPPIIVGHSIGALLAQLL